MGKFIVFEGLDGCGKTSQIDILARRLKEKGEKVYVQAGAGIVADSVPETEYEETANKAGAVIRAIQNAREVDE